MRNRPIIEQAVWLALVLLALFILLLAAVSPPEFLDVNSVYQGF